MLCTTDTAGNNGSDTVVGPTASCPFAGLQKVWQRRWLRPESLSQKLGFGILGGITAGWWWIGGGVCVGSPEHWAGQKGFDMLCMMSMEGKGRFKFNI